jgi:hypothetical protein
MSSNQTRFILEELLSYFIDKGSKSAKVSEFLVDNRLQKYPLSDIYDVIRHATCLFYLKRISSNEMLVCIDIKLKVCHSYNRNKCISGSCDKLHICLNTIFSQNCKSACMLDHNMWSPHNKDILSYNRVYTHHTAIMNFYKVYIY